MDLDKTSNPKQVETYTEDMVKVLSGNKQGFIKEVIQEQEQKEIDVYNLSPESKRNKLFLELSIGFIILAILGFVYVFVTGGDGGVLVKQRFSPLIYHETTKSLDISFSNKEEITDIITNEAIASDLKKSSIEGIYLLDGGKSVGFRKLLSLIKAKISSKQVEPISDNFLMGIVYSDPSLFKQSNTTKEITTVSEITKEGGNIEIEVPGEPVNLSTSSFFKTGTTEFINADAKDVAKKTISDFLDTIDFTTSSIRVTGTYSIERPWEKNEQIAEARRVLGVEILKEVLKEKYSEEEIAKITIESNAKGMSVLDLYSEDEVKTMTKEEKDDAIGSTQGIQYEAGAKTKTKKILVPASPTVEPVTETIVKQKGTTSKHPENKDLFMLLKVRSFADVFLPMREWENKMFEDLHGFFGYNINSETSYLLTKNFEDGIVQNKNARILYDKDKEIVLMYVFADENSLIIANTEGAVREVILRLAGSKIRK